MNRTASNIIKQAKIVELSAQLMGMNESITKEDFGRLKHEACILLCELEDIDIWKEQANDN